MITTIIKKIFQNISRAYLKIMVAACFALIVAFLLPWSAQEDCDSKDGFLAKGLQESEILTMIPRTWTEGVNDDLRTVHGFCYVISHVERQTNIVRDLFEGKFRGLPFLLLFVWPWFFIILFRKLNSRIWTLLIMFLTLVGSLFSLWVIEFSMFWQEPYSGGITAIFSTLTISIVTILAIPYARKT